MMRGLARLLPGVLLFALGCPGEPQGGTELPLLTVTPASARPGELITLGTPTIELAGRQGLQVQIEGRLLPVRVSAEGDFVTGVPILLESGWHAPPPGPVEVVLLEGDRELAAAPDALTIGALERAPGATAALRDDLERTSNAMVAGVRHGLQPSGGEQQIVALEAALDDLLTGTGPHTFATAQATLGSEAPEYLALLDAVLASTGLLEAYRAQADGLETLASELYILKPGGLISAPSDDVSLALKMQFEVIARLFGDQVVHATANTFALTVGTWAAFANSAGAGTASVAIIESVGTVVACLTVFDFLLNKMLLGHLPARVVSLEMSLPGNQVGLGEVFAPLSVTLVAANEPPITTWNDAIGLLLTALGGGAETGVVDDLVKAVDEVWAAIFGTLQGAFAAYAEANPGLALDFELGSAVEDLHWQADIVTPSLLRLVSADSTLLTPTAGGISWQAQDQVGQTSVRIETAGPEGALLPPMAGVIYTGGAFGDTVATTAAETVTVNGDLLLEATFPTTISTGEIVSLAVRAGHTDGAGNPTWGPDIQIALTVDGGDVDTPSGVTDAQGEFLSLVQLLPGFDTVIITVTATDASGQTLDRTVEAGPPSAQGPVLFMAPGTGGLNDIFLISADGSGLTRLTSDAAQDRYPRWNHDHSRVVYNNAEGGREDVWVVDADGSNPTNLTQTIDATEDFADWSPDGSRIAFAWSGSGESGIVAIDPDGGNRVRLTTRLTAGGDDRPRWSPDGSQILYSCNTGGNKEICVVNADGTGQANLSNNGDYNYDPVWSNDGSRIAWTRYLTDFYEIYVMQADGSLQTRLTTTLQFENDFTPQWSADDSQLIFIGDRGSASSQIYRVNADGSGEVRLSSLTNANGGLPASHADPFFSADGQQIVFTSWATGTRDLYRMNADGSGIVLLKSDVGGIYDW